MGIGDYLGIGNETGTGTGTGVENDGVKGCRERRGG